VCRLWTPGVPVRASVCVLGIKFKETSRRGTGCQVQAFTAGNLTRAREVGASRTEFTTWATGQIPVFGNWLPGHQTFHPGRNGTGIPAIFNSGGPNFLWISAGHQSFRLKGESHLHPLRSGFHFPGAVRKRQEAGGASPNKHWAANSARPPLNFAHAFRIRPGRRERVVPIFPAGGNLNSKYPRSSVSVA